MANVFEDDFGKEFIKPLNEIAEAKDTYIRSVMDEFNISEKDLVENYVFEEHPVEFRYNQNHNFDDEFKFVAHQEFRLRPKTKEEREASGGEPTNSRNASHDSPPNPGSRMR